MRGSCRDRRENPAQQVDRPRRSRPRANRPRASENRTAPQLWRGEGTCGSQRLGETVAPDGLGCDADTVPWRVAPSPHTQITAARPPVTARRIDEQLFRPGSWRAIDADNQVVADVRPGTLDQAMDLVGRGRVASFFGQLRPGVLAVDVDMARGEGPVMELVGWCAERGLWHMVRESGRPGHRHVFIVVGDRRGELEQYSATLRAAHGVSRPRIDVRDKVRPLCAPHRSGATPPLPRLDRAARSLPPALRNLPPPASSLPRRTTRPATGGPPPLVAPPRTRRDLPAPWARYLAEGVVPAQVSRWADQSRSAVESCVTYHMVTAGWPAEQAWRAITTSHRQAMGKARRNGRAWWTAYVWNRAVANVAAQAHTMQPQRAGGEPTAGGVNQDVTATAGAVQAAFLAVWDRYGRDRRHTLRFVLDTVCARMARTGSAIVPCPERDLVLDTGITSRRVLREALAELDADGWLQLRRSFDPTQNTPEARSHHVELPEQIPTHPGGVGLRYPPSSFTPLPSLVRAHLGPELCHTYLALPLEDPAPCRSLVALMGLASPGSEPSRAQVGTALGRLQRLAALGLALCDEHGRWVRVAEIPEELQDAAGQSHAQRSAVVAAERTAYALVRAGRGRWACERQAVMDRWRATRYGAACRWFDALPPDEQHARRSAYQARFAALPPVRQRQVKDELACRRADAGVISEDAVRRAWIEAMSSEQYIERVIERTLAFRALPAPMQAATAAAWAEHRARWGITRDLAPLPHRPAPRGPSAAETPEQLDLFALADALARDPTYQLAGLAPPADSGHTAART